MRLHEHFAGAFIGGKRGIDESRHAEVVERVGDVTVGFRVSEPYVDVGTLCLVIVIVFIIVFIIVAIIVAIIVIVPVPVTVPVIVIALILLQVILLRHYLVGSVIVPLWLLCFL
jgi:hypothetical protein